MAIGSVKELIDYERETIKIAQKYGGGGSSADLSLIADEYDETHQYPANDMVVYNNKLYKSTTSVNTPGVFDETMWTEYLPYDPSNTYNSGDYATYEVDGDNKCFRCDEDNTTGDWDASKWTDVSETDFPSYDYASTTPYYPNSSKVALRYPGSYRYFIANSTYAPTGGAGAWNSAKWSETTVEAVINALKKPIPVFVPQFTTDANGCLWLESPAMEGIREPFGIYIQHDGAFNGFSGRVEVVHKYVNDGSPSYTHHDYIGFKFYDENGDVLANWSSPQSLGMTAGIGFLYFN